MKTILIFISLWLTTTLSYSQWMRTNGPEGISINALSSVGDTIYAGTRTDGVYASISSGINWFPMNSGIETKGVLSLASKPGYLFAGTNGSGVYRSTNGGETWLPPSNGTNFYVTAIAVKDSFVYAAADGLFRSSDNGATWQNVYYSPELFHSVCVDKNKIYASEYGYTYLSTDDGTNWSFVHSLDGSEAWCFYCSGDTVIEGASNRIFRSTDFGNSFTQIPVSFDFSFVNFYTIVSSGTDLLAGTSYDGVYKSTDNGVTWSPAKTGMGPKDTRAIVSSCSTVVAGANYAGVYRSTNNGSSWNRSMAGFPAGSTVAGLYASGSTVLAGTYDGVYRSVDNGLNWNKLYGNNDTINYSLVRGIYQNGDTIFAGCELQYHAAVYRSTDNGLTWLRKTSGISTTLKFLNAVTESGNNVLAGTDSGVYYSTNNGENWIHGNGLTYYVTNLATGGGYVYAACDYLGIYRSSDNGVNWNVTISGLDFTSVGAMNNYACVGSSEQGAYVTTNNGSQWFGVSGFPSGESVFSTFYVPNQPGMVLASAYTTPNFIYASYDNGLSFTPYTAGLGINAQAECFTATDSFLIAGMDFNGVWRRLRPGLITSVAGNTNVPHEFKLDQNYPNPFNPSTTITYYVKSQQPVSVKILDPLGREVATLVDETKQPGKYSVVWNASGKASGVYFCRMETKGFSQTRKLVLVK